MVLYQSLFATMEPCLQCLELSHADSTLPGIDFSFCSHRFEASTLLTESGVMTEPFPFTDHG